MTANKGKVLLQVQGLEKKFDDNQVLDGITTDICQGEVVAVIGPSGSGKSTFLRSLNLLEVPTGGKILFEGVDITDPKVDINRHRQKIGMVFQQFNLFPHRSVLENIMLAPVSLKIKSKAEAEQKARELLGVVNLVFFSPEDLNIIKNGPGERRRFMDAELCQLDKLYLTDLAGYNHVLNQRNKLLKDMYMNPSLKETLGIWDMQMLQYGTKIINKRKDFVRDLNQVIQDIHHNLTGGIEHLEVVYEPSTEAEDFENVLKKNRERDIRMKMTSAGPHRDDLSFVVNGIDIRKYGSQGQQRTAALSLKLSEIYLVKEKIKDTPVLLLDDVLSELDSNRQTYLLDCIHDIQTLITCTGLDDFVSNQFHINKVFRVIKGEVYNPVSS